MPKVQSLKHTPLLLTGSIFLQSFSFLSIKFSTQETGLLVWAYLLMALFFLVFRAIIWQILLRYVALSKIYPYTAFVQVLILIYSVTFFDESITLYNILGLLTMLVGIFYMSKKD